MVISGDNIGLYVRSANVKYPLNGSYAAIASLTGGCAELAANVAKHCVHSMCSNGPLCALMRSTPFQCRRSTTKMRKLKG